MSSNCLFFSRRIVPMNNYASTSNAFATIVLVDHTDDLQLPIHLTESDCKKPFMSLLKTLNLHHAITRFHFKNPAKNLFFPVTTEHMFDTLNMLISPGETAYLLVSVQLCSAMRHASLSPVSQVPHVLREASASAQ